MRHSPDDQRSKGRTVLEVQRQVERALSFAERVLERPSEPRIFEVLIFAECVLPQVEEIQPAALREATRLVERVRRLRAVLTALERQVAFRAAGARN